MILGAVLVSRVKRESVPTHGNWVTGDLKRARNIVSSGRTEAGIFVSYDTRAELPHTHTPNLNIHLPYHLLLAVYHTLSGGLSFAEGERECCLHLCRSFPRHHPPTTPPFFALQTYFLFFFFLFFFSFFRDLLPTVPIIALNSLPPPTRHLLWGALLLLYLPST
ncbi:hypothetical protein HOY82DRAFT_41503 [Tuber indicum]|nr:hypothetical protein HOY82DRAFT_41503 [Tuber indicum]